jgi:hypothetical protein
MSRGLGNVQRAIIAGLKPAMAARRDGILRYPGGGHDGKVRERGDYLALADDEYDLRAVLRFLAYGKPGAVHNPVEGSIEPAFSAAFSRAAHGLEERGVLIRSGLSWWPLRIVRLAPDAPGLDHPWIPQARAVLEAQDEADRARRAQVVAALKGLYPHSGV